MFKTSTCAFLLVICACAGEYTETSQRPGEGGKFDVGDATDQGFLEWDTIASDALSNPLELHRYHIDALAGAEYNLVVTTNEDGPDLQLLLFDGDTLIDFSDNAGAGPDPLLSGVFDEAGIYTVVVGAVDGNHSGTYDLELDCESSACMFSSKRIDIEPTELPDEVAQWLEQIPDFECSWFGVQAFDYPWTDETAMPRVESGYWPVLFAYKEIFGGVFIPEWELRPHAGPGGLLGFLDQITTDATFEGFEQAAGLTSGTYQTGRIDFSFGCAPSVTCSGSTYLLLDHDQRRLYTIDFGDADEC